MMSKRLQYKSGEIYGKVMLTGKAYRSKSGKLLVEYICECGKIGWTRLDGLKSGHAKSCGCFHLEKITTQHGLSRHPLMNVWVGVIRRCYDIKCEEYHNYGGRGVTVCDEWRDNFKAFYDWGIANGWQRGLELDKDKLSPHKRGTIYSPEFCCFLTHQENCLHTVSARIIEYKGEKKNLSEWCKSLGLKYPAMLRRIVRDKWDITRAFETKMGIGNTH